MRSVSGEILPRGRDRKAGMSGRVRIKYTKTGAIVSAHGVYIPLCSMEARLLTGFMVHPLITQELACSIIWGNAKVPHTRENTKAYIWRLRRALFPFGIRIIAESQRGYRMETSYVPYIRETYTERRVDGGMHEELETVGIARKSTRIQAAGAYIRSAGNRISGASEIGTSR